MRFSSIGLAVAGCAAAAACLLASSAIAATSASAVLQKMAKAYGGRTVLDAIKTQRVNLSLSIQGQPSTVTTTTERPNRMLEVVSIPAMHLVVTTGFDGANGWVQDTYGHVKALSGDQLSEVSCQADDPVYDALHASKGSSITQEPSQTLDGKNYVVLQVSQKGCQPSTLLVDPKTYLISRLLAPQQTVDFSNYATDAAGEKYPRTLAITSALGTQVGTVTSIEDNVKIDDAIFAMPASAATPAAAPVSSPTPPTVTPAPATSAAPAPAPSKSP